MQSIKKTLKRHNDELQQKFESGAEISILLKERSHKIDKILQDLWQQAGLDNNSQVSLIAVGGYGREEMHPASDVDLLILLNCEPEDRLQTSLSDYVTNLWDLGLEIGHSVRTLEECVDEASKDLTIITNLIESRFLCGNKVLFECLQESITPDKIWSSTEFFKAKVEEQKRRYKRYGDTAYRVEPNLKDGPGGLRDLQTIVWIAIREFGVHSLRKLSEAENNDLLNPREYHDLIAARDFLWKVRFVLHQKTGRKEDRLLFDYQRHLAHSFGYTNDENNQSIESFMQCYYRTIMQLERLNEILLGLLREHILKSRQHPPERINDYYNNIGGYLKIARDDLFETRPRTLLEVFHVIQTTPELKGLTPNTIRQLRRNLHLLDDDFRADPQNKRLFIRIMSEEKGITFVLRRMNRYGVLAAYIPAFENIVGRMQYDLFHAYTVDDHILNVVRNIRRLSTRKGAQELPFCSKIFNTLHKPMILYLAGLFHDIAKGRGGSHSEKGAIDALQFCQSHELNSYDAKTVSWLVEQHLTLSAIAQRKDLADPEVIKQVANIVVSQERLDYLYLLTICDIRGTNPTLLNSWKHSLLRELYQSTRKYLQYGHLNNENTRNFIENKKSAVSHQLTKSHQQDNSHQQVNSHQAEKCEEKQLNTDFWSRFNDDYILQHSVESLSWHISQIHCQSKSGNNQIIIDIRENDRKDSTVLFVYAKDQPDLMVKITSAIEQQNLTIVHARIFSSNDGYALDTFNLLTTEGELLSNPADKQQLLVAIEKNLQTEDFSYDFKHRRMPRQLKHFETQTQVEFDEDKTRQQTLIMIRTTDQPGLLTRIAQVFYAQGINIHGAKISTLGEIAEDIFYVTGANGFIKDQNRQNQIREALIKQLTGSLSENRD